MEIIRKKLHSFISQTKHHPNLFISMVLLLLLPLVVFAAQRQQEIRQHASGNQAAITVTPMTTAAGNPVTVAWTLGVSSPPQIHIAALTTGVSRGEPFTVSWDYKDQKPHILDLFEVFTSSGEHVAYIFLNSCSSIGTDTIPSPTGQCSFDTANYGPGSYTVKVYLDNNRAVPSGEISFQVTGADGTSPGGSAKPAVGISPTSIARGGTITIEWRYNGLTPQPTDYLEIVTSSGEHVGSIYMSGCGSAPSGSPPAEGSCTFTASTIGAGSYLVKFIRNSESLNQAAFTVTADNGFLFIPKAFAQTAFTGAETLQLFTATDSKPAGKQMYLDCTEKTDNIPPPSAPISTGDCVYPISSETPPGSYIFRLFAADGTTVLGTSPAITVTAQNAAAIPGRIIVTYNTNAASQRNNVSDTAAAATIQNLSLDTESIAPNSIVVTTRPGEEDELIAAYQQQPGVVEVIPDYVLQPLATPNDPKFTQQRSMQTLKMPPAWNTGQGQGIKIAVLDTGIASHPDLQERIGLQQDFTGTGLPPTNSHGTAVAGVTAATYNNNLGIAGTAGKATLLNAKVGGETISLAAALEAIRWATDNGAKVINMSFGGRYTCFQAIQDTVDYAWNRGVILVAGAGNEGENGVLTPASCNHVIAVGAVNTAGTNKMTFSNYGSSVPIAATGDDEITTNADGTYGSWYGTSIAAGYVSGLAALLYEKYPSASPELIKTKILASAKPMVGFTQGIIDAEAALSTTATPIPTITATPLPSPTATLIPTPTIIPTTPPTVTACSPRPPVRIQSVKTGDGRLQVTVSVTNNPGFSNTLKAITWNGLVNSSIEGLASVTQGGQTSFPSSTQTTTFFVGRTTPGQSTTVSFDVVDDCGNWKTFVGGGPSAF